MSEPRNRKKKLGIVKLLLIAVVVVIGGALFTVMTMCNRT
jgi:flagellar basal body-associated protein FliL